MGRSRRSRRAGRFRGPSRLRVEGHCSRDGDARGRIGARILEMIGDTVRLSARATLSDGTAQDVPAAAAWQSSNAQVVRVSAGGLVTATGPGTAQVTATHQEMTGSEAVAVVTVTNVEVSADTVSMKIGSPTPLSALARRSNGSSIDVTGVASWSSSDPAIARVSSSGVVTALAPGRVAITARYNGASGSHAFSVILLQSLRVSGRAFLAFMGDTAQMAVVATYTDGSTRPLTTGVTWTSLQPTTVSVSNAGGATALGSRAALSGKGCASLRSRPPPFTPAGPFRISFVPRCAIPCVAVSTVSGGARSTHGFERPCPLVSAYPTDC